MTTSFTDLQADFKALQNKMDVLRDEIKEKSKAFFKDASKALFEKHPNLETFRWTQYTPYFNDGDPCLFSVHSDYPEVAMAGENIEDQESYEMPDRENEPQKYAAYGDVTTLLNTFRVEDFEDMFGDHCQVTVTRDKVEVEEYSHD
jgi:hypothetical protein